MFQVVYCQGGTARFSWNRTTQVAPSPAGLTDFEASIRRMGYATRIIRQGAALPTEFQAGC